MPISESKKFVGAPHLVALLVVVMVAVLWRERQVEPPSELVDEVRVMGTLASRSAFEQALPLFKKDWHRENGRELLVEESYQRSDVLLGDLPEEKEGLLIAAWPDCELSVLRAKDKVTGPRQQIWAQDTFPTSEPYRTVVGYSPVAFAVRPGNPKGIRDWSDLGRSGVEVLNPDPATNSQGLCHLLALQGAALRGKVRGVQVDDPEAAMGFRLRVSSNLVSRGKTGEECLSEFQQGIGDVVLGSEQILTEAMEQGRALEIVVPTSTMLLEYPLIVPVQDGPENATALKLKEFFESEKGRQVLRACHLRDRDIHLAPDRPLDFFTLEDVPGWKRVISEYRR